MHTWPSGIVYGLGFSVKGLGIQGCNRDWRVGFRAELRTTRRLLAPAPTLTLAIGPLANSILRIKRGRNVPKPSA